VREFCQLWSGESFVFVMRMMSNTLTKGKTLGFSNELLGQLRQNRATVNLKHTPTAFALLILSHFT
jgi:hypothetical protein